MNSPQNDPLPSSSWWQRFRRLFPRSRTRHPDLNVQHALRWMYQIGKEAGRNEQPPVVYAASCKRHSIPLVEIETGRFECPSCRALLAHNDPPRTGRTDAIPALNTLPESAIPQKPFPPAQTPLVPLVPLGRTGSPTPPMRPLFQYRRQLHPPDESGPQTQQHRAMHWTPPDQEKRYG